MEMVQVRQTGLVTALCSTVSLTRPTGIAHASLCRFAFWRSQSLSIAPSDRAPRPRAAGAAGGPSDADPGDAHVSWAKFWVASGAEDDAPIPPTVALPFGALPLPAANSQNDFSAGDLVIIVSFPTSEQPWAPRPGVVIEKIGVNVTVCPITQASSTSHYIRISKTRSPGGVLVGPDLLKRDPSFVNLASSMTLGMSAYAPMGYPVWIQPVLNRVTGAPGRLTAADTAYLQKLFCELRCPQGRSGGRSSKRGTARMGSVPVGGPDYALVGGMGFTPAGSSPAGGTGSSPVGKTALSPTLSIGLETPVIGSMGGPAILSTEELHALHDRACYEEPAAAGGAESLILLPPELFLLHDLACYD